MGLLSKSENKKTERVYEITSYVEATIINCKEIENKFDIDGKDITQRYLEISAYNEDGSFYLKDKNLSRKELYKPQTSGVFEILIHVEEKFKGKTTVEVAEFAANVSLDIRQ